jgi:hypothetical protein
VRKSLQVAVIVSENSQPLATSGSILNTRSASYRFRRTQKWASAAGDLRAGQFVHRPPPSVALPTGVVRPRQSETAPTADCHRKTSILVAFRHQLGPRGPLTGQYH